MKKVNFIGGVLILVFAQAYPAIGTPLEVSVITSKPTFLLGEDIDLSVIAFNPNDYMISLEPHAYYKIDELDWMPWYPMIIVPPIELQPFNSYQWNLKYLHHDNPSFPLLGVGVHSVSGKSAIYTEAYVQSGFVQFSVVPEPATVAFLLLGMLAMVKRPRRREKVQNPNDII